MKVQSPAEQLLFTTVHIDITSADGTVGSGTGFIFIHNLDEHQIPIIVTNKHVVEGVHSGSITFTLREGNEPNLGQGYRLDIPDFATVWFGHPDPAIDHLSAYMS